MNRKQVATAQINARSQALQQAWCVGCWLLMVAAILLTACRTAGGSETQTLNQPVAQSKASGTAIMWRYTRNGWQDVAAMIEPASIEPSRFQQVHPFVWAGVLLTSSISVAVWASSEWDVDRLLHRRSG